MTVFKGYLLMFKKNIGLAIMYFAIFISIALLISAVSAEEKSKSFAAAKVDIAVVDMDNSELSENLVKYLQKKHEVELAKDNKSALYEKLYYGEKSLVLRIGKGFEKKAFEGEVGIHLTNRPGSYSGMYLEQQINLFVGNVMSYLEAGYGMEEACQKVAARQESKVSIEDINGNGGDVPAYLGFFQYLPYLFICVFGAVLGKNLYTFRRKNVKNRAMSSPVSLIRQNGETVLAFLVIGAGLYLLCCVIAFILYGESVLTSPNLGWYLLNAFMDMLTALAIAFLVGLLVKSEMQVNIVITPVSLGLSFLCGVFVPLNVMGEQIRTIAKFLPVYWYEVVNNLLTDYADISGEIQTQVITGIGIQFLFVLALTGVGMAIAKYQQQER